MKTPLLLLLSLLTLSSCAHRDGSQLQSALPGTQMRSGDIQLDLRTDKPRYRAGEKVSITLKSDQRCRVKLYSLDAQGQRTEIWPRPRRPGHHPGCWTNPDSTTCQCHLGPQSQRATRDQYPSGRGPHIAKGRPPCYPSQHK
ncbi:MAG: hypothetical protein IPK32_07995 [Verrucomicrobiaceae bacterium]|nr:hypothetical protein [Verrucomicrobiaceae bacterium]